MLREEHHMLCTRFPSSSTLDPSPLMGHEEAKAAARLDNALRHFLFSGSVTLSARGWWTR